MDFRLLGPLEIESGGSLVRIAGSKERAVLALLLFRANRLVSRDRLIDELWGERPPVTATHTLEAYVSRLRRSLSTAGGDGMIESQPGGYRIRLGADDLDTLRFERLVDEGRSALARGEPAMAQEQLSAALALWRGDVLADLALEPSSAAEVGRLEELRLAAVEARSTAALELGRHAELTGELGALVAEHPFREGLRAQLMLALYRSGRQAEALATYLDGRRRLVDELGIEPGGELQGLQQAILRHDPALDWAPIVVEEPRAAVADGSTGAAAPASQERRKVVTVVACVLGGSTALAERLDPEAFEGLLVGYRARMTELVERHGGTVTASVPDTVVAVFGVPLLHEDDALRACRAALEMRAALSELGVVGHLALTTGVVIAGPDALAATGAAVQLAAELAQAGPRGAIVLGPETARLLGPLVDVQPLAPLVLRGRAEPMAAFRLRRLAASVAPESTSFVDRERELSLLADAFRRTVDERELHLVTLLGPAGIGKSRLAREFLDSVGAGVRVARGRCLSYGRAITWWPLTELLRALGRPARQSLERVVAGSLVSGQELATTVRRALEQAAVDRPLVVVIEDLHWAEPALLDLLDSVCEDSRGYPILFLCVARPELLEQRPGWSGGKLNAATVLLEPLGALASERLVDALRRPLGPDERERVIRVAAGNPLFLEELTEFVAEGGGGDLPPRIHALLQARLDRLPDLERRVLWCAAVEGNIFHVGGLETLLPGLRAELSSPLTALARKLLIRAVPAQLDGDEAFGFRHQLIRDVAYAAIPKADRARMHERFAGWLEQHTGDRGELAEIAAHHLEQAAVAKRELGARDPELDARAADQLAAAGERARRRSDPAAAASLWQRALALLEADDPRAPRLELALADVLLAMGRHGQAREFLERAGLQTADAAVAAAVRVALLRGRMFIDPDAPAAARRACAEAIPLFEQRGDHRLLASAWHTLASADRAEMLVVAAADEYSRAAAEAHITGDRAVEAFELGLRTTMLGESRIPYADAVLELEPIAARFPGEPFIEPMLVALRGYADYHAGRLERARTLVGEGLDGLRRSRYAPVAIGVRVRVARAELLAGNIDEAERLASDAIDAQREMDLGFRGHAKAILAEIRIAQGRFHEALELTHEVKGTGGPDARLGLVVATSARARALAHLGEIADAKSAADEAFAIACATESLDAQARAGIALAEVLAAAGDLSAALAAAEAAGRLYRSLDRRLERRHSTTLASQIRRRIAAAGARLPSSDPRGSRRRGPGLAARSSGP